MDEQKVNAIINVGQLKVAEKAYDDLVSEPAKNLGTALSTIVDFGNTILWPIKWLNERTRIYFQTNIKKYEVKLNEISEQNVTAVPTEISMPILERFTYVSNEDLSNAFVKLLTSASSTETIEKAHPGFIYIIDRLSPDEAKILSFLKSKPEIAAINAQFYKDPNTQTFNHIVENYTGLENRTSLVSPQNIGLYLDNLISLGLLKNATYFRTYLTNEFKKLEAEISDKILHYKSEDVDEDKFNRQIRIQQGMYLVTNYGKLFLDACID